MANLRSSKATQTYTSRFSRSGSYHLAGESSLLAQLISNPRQNTCPSVALSSVSCVSGRDFLSVPIDLCPLITETQPLDGFLTLFWAEGEVSTNQPDFHSFSDSLCSHGSFLRSDSKCFLSQSRGGFFGQCENLSGLNFFPLASKFKIPS